MNGRLFYLPHFTATDNATVISKDWDLTIIIHIKGGGDLIKLLKKDSKTDSIKNLLLRSQD